MLIEFLNTDFKLENENGTLVQLVHDGWKQVNVITSLAGQKRGGHYHKYNDEAFYTVSGSYKLYLRKGEDQEEYLIRPGMFFKLPPYVFHTFEYLEDTVLVSMYSSGVELTETEKDIWNQ